MKTRVIGPDGVAREVDPRAVLDCYRGLERWSSGPMIRMDDTETLRRVVSSSSSDMKQFNEWVKEEIRRDEVRRRMKKFNPVMFLMGRGI